MNSNLQQMVVTLTAREAMLEKSNVVACILVRPEADYQLNFVVLDVVGLSGQHVDNDNSYKPKDYN